MKKRIGKVVTHSCIDVITNSSTELFCTVKGKRDVIVATIMSIMEEVGCSAVDMEVSEMEDDETGEIIKGQYGIWYDYEMKHEPCDLIKRKLKEKLNMIED